MSCGRESYSSFVIVLKLDFGVDVTERRPIEISGAILGDSAGERALSVKTVGCDGGLSLLSSTG